MSAAARFPRPLGIVCGLRSEKRSLVGWYGAEGVEIAISGARPDRATEHAERMVADGCRALLSVGFAGGLDPGLRAGDLFAGSEVVTAEGERLPLALPPCPAPRTLRIFGSDRLVRRIADKEALFAASGAPAVDMETHRVARVARTAGIPAYALRAICDPATRELPGFLETAVDETGTPRLFTILGGLLLNPGRIGTLIALGQDQTAARKALAGWARSAAASGG